MIKHTNRREVLGAGLFFFFVNIFYGWSGRKLRGYEFVDFAFWCVREGTQYDAVLTPSAGSLLGWVHAGVVQYAYSGVGCGLYEVGAFDSRLSDLIWGL